MPESHHLRSLLEHNELGQSLVVPVRCNAANWRLMLVGLPAASELFVHRSDLFRGQYLADLVCCS